MRTRADPHPVPSSILAICQQLVSYLPATTAHLFLLYVAFPRLRRYIERILHNVINIHNCFQRET